jgi:hypothetical protein
MQCTAVLDDDKSWSWTVCFEALRGASFTQFLSFICRLVSELAHVAKLAICPVTLNLITA